MKLFHAATIAAFLLSACGQINPIPATAPDSASPPTVSATADATLPTVDVTPASSDDSVPATVGIDPGIDTETLFGHHGPVSKIYSARRFEIIGPYCGPITVNTNDATVFTPAGYTPHLGDVVRITTATVGCHGLDAVAATVSLEQSAPSPSPTESPTPEPSSSPSGAYKIYGCTVPTLGSVADASVDPSSSQIVAHVSSGNFFGGGDEVGDFRLNLAESKTPRVTVAANSWRHPPIYGDDSEAKPSPFFIQPTSDAHAEVLNTQTCEYWETYGTRSVNGGLSAYAGDSEMLNTSKYSPQHNPTTVSNIWLMGLTDYGEDASLPAINHPIQFIASLHAYDPTHYTGIASAAETSGDCRGGVSSCLIAGDVIRLKSTVSCPSGAVGKLCVQLKEYGAILSDGACCYGLRMGEDASGNDPWTNYSTFASSLTMRDFDIVKRGTVH